MPTIQSAEEIIDAKIQELEAEKQELAELKRLAKNPRMVELMRHVVGATSNGAVPHQPVSPPRPPQQGTRHTQWKSAPNGLSIAVLEAAKILKTGFSNADVVNHLNKIEFPFVSANPRVAVSAPLERLVDKEVLKLVRRGTGNLPNLYDYIGV